MEKEIIPASLLVPPSEIENRTSRFQEMMVLEGLDGVLISQNVDLFYFSGTMQPGYLYIPAGEEPVFFSRKNLERAREESSSVRILPLASLKKLPDLIADLDLPDPQILGLEMDVLPAANYLQQATIFQSARIQDASLMIRKCRMLKSSWEIEQIAEAGRMLNRMVLEVPKILKPGLSEMDLAAALEAFLRRQGHQGYIRSRGFNQEMFYGHILSGPEGGKPAYLDSPSGGLGLGPAFGQGVGMKPIRRGEPISVDYVGCFNGYLADQTRMFSLGRPPQEVIEAYRAAQTIQESIIARAQPGVTCSQLYFWALDETRRLGYAPFFMGLEPSQSRYIGHGLGLELDEFPVIGQKFDWPLEPGMALALEPKMVLPEYGMVGIENTFVVTETGLRPLTIAPEEFHIL
ncbi:MAG: Xaa-Pro peptidase family protein [Thermodesulfobacteriota bacterium]